MEPVTAFGLIAGVLVVVALAAGLVARASLSFPMLLLSLGRGAVRHRRVRGAGVGGRPGSHRHHPFSSWYTRKASQETLVEERAGTAAELFTQSPDDVPRVTPAQLFDRLKGPNSPLILDAPQPLGIRRDGVRIPGSVRVLPDQVVESAADRLRDQPFAYPVESTSDAAA